MSKLQVKRVKEVVLDFPGLGKKIRQVREQDERSLTEICRESGISRSYWYQIEAEDLRSPATEEIIRKIEKVLSVDLGVKFDD
jgi:transcriptional regulator with XRE-family HTH domain